MAPTTVADVRGFLEELYPLSWAEDWDRVGLVVGRRAWEVNRIRLAVDPTLAEAREAARIPGTLLVTHHPLLLRGASFMSDASGKGEVVTTLIESRGALWCGHTNADRSLDGTVGAWIRALDLEDAAPLVPPQQSAEEGSRLFGLGAVGNLADPASTEELANRIASFASRTAQGVLFTGDPGRAIERVAVCPGAGDSFLEAATKAGVDCYITSDLRHHPALEHLEASGDHALVPALIDLPHSASEALYLPHLAGLLGERFPDLDVEVSTLSSDPFTGAAR